MTARLVGIDQQPGHLAGLDRLGDDAHAFGEEQPLANAEFLFAQRPDALDRFVRRAGDDARHVRRLAARDREGKATGYSTRLLGGTSRMPFDSSVAAHSRSAATVAGSGRA